MGKHKFERKGEDYSLLPPPPLWGQYVVLGIATDAANAGCGLISLKWR